MTFPFFDLTALRPVLEAGLDGLELPHCRTVVIDVETMAPALRLPEPGEPMIAQFWGSCPALDGGGGFSGAVVLVNNMSDDLHAVAVPDVRPTREAAETDARRHLDEVHGEAVSVTASEFRVN